MRMRITTTYNGVDKEWLDWYLKRLANEEVLPGSAAVAEELKECDFASFSSKDPDSNVTAATEYEILERKYE